VRGGEAASALEEFRDAFLLLHFFSSSNTWESLTPLPHGPKYINSKSRRSGPAPKGVARSVSMSCKNGSAAECSEASFAAGVSKGSKGSVGVKAVGTSSTVIELRNKVPKCQGVTPEPSIRISFSAKQTL